VHNPDTVECPLELTGNGPVQHAEFNHVLRLVNRFHLEPIKTKLDTVNRELEKHVQECALRQAQILGGLRVIKWLSGAIIASLSLVATLFAKYMGWL